MGLVAAAAFTWLGMVLAISFLEAPLKFRAPGVTVPLGLGIGRLVFAALNRVELVLLLLVAGGLLLAGTRPALVLVAAALAAAVLAAQLGLIRPALNRRSERVLAGEELPRSRAHLYYVVLEVAKVVALVLLGATALTPVG
ncbi:hypothetical protein FB558_3408 [Pseudonocardia kunmingensis]|uniref:Transmembrane protein n=1 Tax=Pseudonocardia kunmingensis TaxID=630975 RepID=A0A543DNL6_9PSEU|nr:hypothetical protein FB558_3408 [Pseudonocardia kunmingensis]